MLSKTAKIAILWYGQEWKSTENFLLKNWYENITILDEKIDWKMIWNNLEQYDYIFRTPWISPLKPELQKASHFRNITSNTELFFDLCPCPIIWVTGTKWKWTTSSLIYKILKNTWKKCFIWGNIGTPPLDLFKNKINKTDLVVLELSSFQTFTLKKSPYISVVLMTTQEHLDYHKNIYEYIYAKSQMVKHQNIDDICIYNNKYPNSIEIASNSKWKKIIVNKDCYITNDIIIYKNEEIININEIKLPWKHNWENVMAAVCVAKSLDIDNETIKNTIKNFKGLPLRIEKIAEINWVKYINDSFSTTPETTIAAINSFPNKKISVMIWGSDKGSNYKELIQVLKNNKNITAICYWEMWKKISELIKLSGKTEIIEAANFEDAFNKAKNVHGVEIVLLSPACASFDLFKNYKERWENFNSLVNFKIT